MWANHFLDLLDALRDRDLFFFFFFRLLEFDSCEPDLDFCEGDDDGDFRAFFDFLCCVLLREELLDLLWRLVDLFLDLLVDFFRERLLDFLDRLLLLERLLRDLFLLPDLLLDFLIFFLLPDLLLDFLVFLLLPDLLLDFLAFLLLPDLLLDFFFFFLLRLLLLLLPFSVDFSLFFRCLLRDLDDDRFRRCFFGSFSTGVGDLLLSLLLSSLPWELSLEPLALPGLASLPLLPANHFFSFSL